GARAAELSTLPMPGVDVRLVGDELGTASAIKMSTASIYKSRAVLLAQALRAARAYGVLEPVLDDLRRSHPDLVEEAPFLLQSIASRSDRCVAEMEEIASSQEQVGLTPDLFNAVADVFLRLRSTEAAGRAPEDLDVNATLDEVLATLD